MPAARQTDDKITNDIFLIMPRCLKCQSTVIDKTQVRGSVIQWFTCQNCKHAWCRVDEQVDPPPAQITPDSDNSPDS